MKQKKTSSRKKYTPSSTTINKLLVKLESCHNALEEHKNFNLAEVLISEYYNNIPPQLVDKRLAKSVLNALRDRNAELLLSTVEAEIERLRVEKIKLLHQHVTQS